MPNIKDSELNGIEGLTFYDQEDFEENVTKKFDDQIDKQKKEEDVKRLQIELQRVDTNLERALKNLAKVEQSLQDAVSKGITSDRRLQTFLDDQDKYKKEIANLRESKKEILSDMKQTSAEKEEEENVKTEESQQEKSIRLGQMTAFGKVLASKSQQGGQRNYVRDWMDTEETSTDDDEVDPLRGDQDKSKNTRSPDWRTDDSDWDSSDQEDNDDKAINKELPKKKSQKFNTIDDGDKALYLERLKEWQEDSGALDSDSKYEELEGGLRVPSKMWHSLYHYQKVAVQWMWELHQQDVGGILGDEMGLGKTVQLVAFLASLSYSSKKLRSPRLKTALIVTPTTVMHQWVREFHTWWAPFRVAILHETGSYQGSKDQLIRTIGKTSGILITSYSSILKYKEVLTQQDFDYVVLDEGHKIRNPDAQVTLAVKQFTTSHRLILSGSPLQNNLKELWSLFDFIYPGKLGTLPVFMQHFSIPITMGGYSNANRSQVATAHKCATVLRDTINPYLLRRLKSDVKSHINLPGKNEQVLFCRLTEEQRQMYRDYLDSGEVKGILDGRLQVFLGLIALRKICNHPDLHDGGPKYFGSNVPEQPVDEFGYWKRSGKMIVVESLLKLWKKQGHKVLLFTQSRQMLKVLENFLQDYQYSYVKMDGTTAIGSRQSLINRFNSTSDLFVFLLTTRVGGLGVNLTGANRVVIFDPDWNPSTDTQARERAWRIGQDRDVTIYRLLTSGTIEEKIYHRQIFKQLLINRVLKDPTQKRFFKSNDLYDLFTLNEGTSDATETSAIFAGTNSEIRSKEIRKRKKLDDAVRDSAIRPTPRKVKKIDTFKVIQEDLTTEEKQDQKSQMSEKEREKLRAKVRLISMKIGKKEIPERNKDSEKKPSKKKKKSKNTKKKDAKFEGERVSHLDKTDVFKQAVSMPNDGEKEDNYVLSKLFKKSGVHSALKHDMIMDGDGNADFALIDAEAERVAKEAVQRLRQSRRQCFRASEGIPTWTGSHGAQKRPRFGQKVKKNDVAKTKQQSMSAKDLLTRMKERNRLLPNQGQSNSYEGQDLFQPDAYQGFESNVDLLADIRNFIAFQNDSAGNGESTTEALVTHFKEKLPPVKNPLFKALLNEICDYSKNSAAKGIWRLKEEFR